MDYKTNLSAIQLAIDTKEKLDAYVKVRKTIQEEYNRKTELLKKHKIQGYSTCWSPLGTIGIHVKYEDGSEVPFNGNFIDFLETLE